ncbi:hypothetical protein [Nonomuraea gerenzanensis]|uniref:Uncharacterized protein n=1 Tax=Nonomuraea gerenzanensis TaxID=93944 RepID=A0A1M4DWQ5_9ACTN|nr:hypothetical protein [Nonomuraea gerenzanensis]UBU13346.1 hypothetical protein LCN96_55495 [Nonomuraea gerenzanensis]SBO91004.1 hypothetical protein BN4615_P518 [Nonomuraea gerenzanensis]
MAATIVFIHGRGQEGKDPKVLLGEWCTALAAGLRVPRLTAQCVLPYYGNVLHRVTAQAAKQSDVLTTPADGAEEVPFHPFLPEDVGELERRLVADLAAGTGVPQEMLGISDLLSWTLARRLLTWVSKNTSVDKEIIKMFLQDVAVYLSHGRRPVLDEVRRHLPPTGDLVLVSHSLGTVVARDLLVEDAVRRRVLLWVTAGSPLGLPTIQRNLLARGTRHPGVRWLTTYDLNDIVAIGHPLERGWGTPLSQVEVENRDTPHAIDRYLRHLTVAGPIGRACA